MISRIQKEPEKLQSECTLEEKKEKNPSQNIDIHKLLFGKLISGNPP